MPDALSKTVPIWCAVINLAIELRRKRKPVAEIDDGDWDAQLYLPPRIVSASEKAQIESLLPMWAAALEVRHPGLATLSLKRRADPVQASALPLPPLSLPLRPFFIHPSTSVPPHIPGFPSYIPIICLSASRWVNEENGDEIPSFSKLRDGRTMGFEYVPGAGDDDELWGRACLLPLQWNFTLIRGLGIVSCGISCEQGGITRSL